MSALIIPFPTGVPARALIRQRLADVRHRSGLGASMERRAYLAGFIDGHLSAVAPPQAPQRRQAKR